MDQRLIDTPGPLRVLTANRNTAHVSARERSGKRVKVPRLGEVRTLESFELCMKWISTPIPGTRTM
jgi:hypothetical protein